MPGRLINVNTYQNRFYYLCSEKFRKMFSRYWRSYPWWMQLILFVLTVFILAYFCIAVAGVVVPRIMGVEATALRGINENSPRSIINAALVYQFLTSMGIFLLPPLLFANLAHPDIPFYLGLRRPGKSIQWILVILIIVGAMPLLLTIESWMQHIDLGSSAKALQEQNDNLVKAFLNINTPLQFISAFGVLAILPALGEELLFRGVLMRFAAKRSRGITFPIIISSLMFAGMHSSITGFLPIFLAGSLLATIYYLTGSLWCSILGHLVHNGLQVCIMYFAKDSAYIKAIEKSNELPPYIPFIGAVIFGIGLFLLIKHKTPLPPNWSDDYSEEELSEKGV